MDIKNKKCSRGVFNGDCSKEKCLDEVIVSWDFGNGNKVHLCRNCARFILGKVAHDFLYKGYRHENIEEVLKSKDEDEGIFLMSVLDVAIYLNPILNNMKK